MTAPNLSDAELARAWDVPRSTVHRWRRRGIDPASPRSVVRGASTFCYAPRADIIERLKARADAVRELTGRD